MSLPSKNTQTNLTRLTYESATAKRLRDVSNKPFRSIVIEVVRQGVDATWILWHRGSRHPVSVTVVRRLLSGSSTTNFFAI